MHLKSQTAVSIYRSTRIAKGSDKIQIIIGIPLEGIVVVVDQNGIRPTLIGEFKSLDEPVVASLAFTTQRFLQRPRG